MNTIQQQRINRFRRAYPDCPYTDQEVLAHLDRAKVEYNRINREFARHLLQLNRGSVQ